MDTGMDILIFYSLLLLCSSDAHPWDEKPQVDGSFEGENQLRKEFSHEDSSTLSPVTEVKIIKSVLPLLGQEENESRRVILKSDVPFSSGNVVNTTIRLKFAKKNSGQASEGVIGVITTEKPTEYDFRQGVINSNEHATRPHTQEMSSHRIMAYNQTKTQQASKTSSQSLSQQLRNINWPVDDDNETNFKDFIVQKGAQVNLNHIIPIGEEKNIAQSDEMDTTRSKDNRNNQNVLLEILKHYLDSGEQHVTTEKSIEQLYDISDAQMQLLNLLHKLVQSNEITYDFIKRLLNLFYMHGYQNQLLSILFDFIMEQMQSHGHSNDQQKLLNNLLEFWNMLHRLQRETQKDISNENNNIITEESSLEELRVVQLLQLIGYLKESIINNENILSLRYLNELKSLYDSYDNKDHLTKVMYDYWKKHQSLNKNKQKSTTKKASKVLGDTTKNIGINGFPQLILKDKGLTNKKGDVENIKKSSYIDNNYSEKYNVLSQEERIKIRLDTLSKEKNTLKKNPNDNLVVQQVNKDIEDGNEPLSVIPVSKSNLLRGHSKIKKPTPISKLNERENTKNMYQMFIRLLSSTDIRNKEELEIKIIEMLNKMKSQEIDTSNESDTSEESDTSDEPTPREEGQGDLNDIWNIMHKLKNKVDDKIEKCTVAASWLTNCHRCVCVEGGVPVCKKISDCAFRQPGEPMQCKPYSEYKLDECNKCTCNGDGIPVCTYMECQEPRSGKKESFPKQDALQAILCPPEKKLPLCAPGTSWRSECQDCICDDRGQKHCNKVVDCKLLPYGQPSNCQPNTTFVKGCKKCNCTDEGQHICVSIC